MLILPFLKFYTSESNQYLQNLILIKSNWWFDMLEEGSYFATIIMAAVMLISLLIALKKDNIMNLIFNHRQHGKLPIPLKKNLTWLDIERAVLILQKEIETKHQFDIIISISNGGTIAGAMLSTLLNIPLFSVVRENPKLQENQPQISLTNLQNDDLMHNLIQNKNVLLFDDAVHAGNTLKHYIEEVKKYKPKEFITVSLVCIGIQRPAKPDIYVYEHTLSNFHMPYDYSQLRGDETT